MERKWLKNTLNLIFDSEDRKEIAHWLLVEVKNRQRSTEPYLDSDGQKFCSERGYSYSIYSQVLVIIKKHGLVKKIGHTILLSDEFIEQLDSEWRKFLHC